jgi:hypothetical protein
VGVDKSIFALKENNAWVDGFSHYHLQKTQIPDGTGTGSGVSKVQTVHLHVDEHDRELPARVEFKIDGCGGFAQADCYHATGGDGGVLTYGVYLVVVSGKQQGVRFPPAST